LGDPLAGSLDHDDDGFVMTPLSDAGIFPVGCARAPVDVTTSTRDATAAALHSIHQLVARS
jgi:heterodisulfide reductase subunit A-like polyferredoxin